MDFWVKLKVMYVSINCTYTYLCFCMLHTAIGYTATPLAIVVPTNFKVSVTYNNFHLKNNTLKHDYLPLEYDTTHL